MAPRRAPATRRKLGRELINRGHVRVRAYESGSGKKLRVERLGSLEDLDARIDELKKAGPANFLAYLQLIYYRSILNGEGKLDEVMNGRNPAIRPTTAWGAVQIFAEMLRRLFPIGGDPEALPHFEPSTSLG